MEPNIGDNPFIIDTLWGTAGQAVDSCLGGGDIKDLMGYFQRQGLL